VGHLLCRLLSYANAFASSPKGCPEIGVFLAGLGLIVAAGTAPAAHATPVAVPPAVQAAPSATGCEPTRRDALGPFYVPGAPLRASVGQGYQLTGTVRAADDCSPLPGAQIEFWLANPRGVYDDAHRATVLAEAEGEYRFESNVPVAYGGRPPHIHVRVSAPGFRTLVTQHYPGAGATEATFDLVLARG
jgi:protocatechuate 3,4-dioxygenase beta subunit